MFEFWCYLFIFEVKNVEELNICHKWHKREKNDSKKWKILRRSRIERELKIRQESECINVNNMIWWWKRNCSDEMQKWSFIWTRVIWNEIKWRSLQRLSVIWFDFIGSVCFEIEIEMKQDDERKRVVLFRMLFRNTWYVNNLLKNFGKTGRKQNKQLIDYFPYFCANLFWNQFWTIFFLASQITRTPNEFSPFWNSRFDYFWDSNWTFQKQIDHSSEYKHNVIKKNKQEIKKLKNTEIN